MCLLIFLSTFLHVIYIYFKTGTVYEMSVACTGMEHSKHMHLELQDFRKIYGHSHVTLIPIYFT